MESGVVFNASIYGKINRNGKEAPVKKNQSPLLQRNVARKTAYYAERVPAVPYQLLSTNIIRPGLRIPEDILRHITYIWPRVQANGRCRNLDALSI